MRTILKQLKRGKVQRDFTDIGTTLDGQYEYPKQQEDKRLKYLTQHHYQIMYPCPWFLGLTVRTSAEYTSICSGDV